MFTVAVIGIQGFKDVAGSCTSKLTNVLLFFSVTMLAKRRHLKLIPGIH